MSSVQGALRRLERLNETCGGVSSATIPAASTVGEEPIIDTSSMSVYERGQYRIACCMKRARENIARMEGSKDAMCITRRAELSNSIRRDISTMKKDAAALYRVAVKEGRREEHTQLMTHVSRTEKLQRALFAGQLLDDDLSERGGSYIAASGATTFIDSTALQSSSVPLISVHDDDEFALFFRQTTMRDTLMDEALDRIDAGLTRLNDNALTLQSELSVQQRLLDETETKVDNVHDKLTSMNARLRQALKAVEKDRMAMYCCCCILLLSIVGGIYFAAR